MLSRVEHEKNFITSGPDTRLKIYMSYINLFTLHDRYFNHLETP